MNHEDIISGLVPIVIEQSNRGERSFDIYSRLLRERIVFVTGGVEDHMASLITAQIALLESEKSEEGHLHVHQLAGRGRHGGHGDPRHDAIYPAAGRHGLHRPGRLDGRFLLSAGEPGCGSRSPTAGS
jgi:ATP-dependent Clp protease protease subunit